MKHKILWMTLCYNEEQILPWCIDYWKRVADKVIVFDNYSTDSSIDILSKEDFIEIKKFKTDGQDDVMQAWIKNTKWQQYKDEYDYIIWTDTDELLYSDDLDSILDEMDKGGYNVLGCPIYALCEDSKPNYEDGKLLHQLCHKFYKQRMNHQPPYEHLAKFSLFNPKLITETGFSVGQHIANFKPSMKMYETDKAFILHVDKGFGVIEKYKIRQKMNKHLSDTNRKYGLCYEYGNDFETLKKEYENNQSKSFDINVQRRIN